MADVEELFIYQFLSNIDITPSVHFYVNQKRPDCLLIATANGSTITTEKFYTAVHYPAIDLNSLTIEEIIQIRIIEIIFCLKDILSNQDNYGWLHPSKKIFIIDFSINKDEAMKINPTPPSIMLNDDIPDRGRLATSKLIQNLMHSRVRKRN